MQNEAAFYFLAAGFCAGVPAFIWLIYTWG